MPDSEMFKYVEASFKHGKISSDGQIQLMKILLIIILVCALLSVLILFFMPLTTYVEPYMIITNSIIVVVTIGMGVLLYYSVKVKHKQKKEILLCLEDAVEANATFSRLDVYGSQFAPYQVQADFKIGDIEFHKISLPGNAFSGYHKVFAKYHNNKVNILYSPKYDTVLVLKPVR